MKARVGSNVSLLPILARRVGMGKVGQSMLVTLNLALIGAGSLVVARLSKRFGAKPLAAVIGIQAIFAATAVACLAFGIVGTRYLVD